MNEKAKLSKENYKHHHYRMFKVVYINTTVLILLFCVHWLGSLLEKESITVRNKTMKSLKYKTRSAKVRNCKVKRRPYLLIYISPCQS